MNGEACTFADIFMVINRVFTTTSTFSMNIHSQISYTFTDTFYTSTVTGKKINIIPHFPHEI